jgi:hypothetical protein
MAVPLQDLAQRISQQQAELERLRREYEARQTQLSRLSRRKEELQAQLQRVEAEIQGIGRGSAPPKSATSKPAAAKPGGKPAAGVSLPQLLVRIVGQAGRPITAKELAQEALRQKYTTTSRDFPALVENRVGELVKKGLLRRAPAQGGVLPGQPRSAAKAAPAKAHGGPQRKGPKPAAPPKSAPTAAPGGAGGEQPPLTAVVMKLLSKSQRPIPARELAEQVLATGYKTASKNFTHVIWVALAKMKDVKNVPGEGYRLKTAKAAAHEGKGSK